jgi:glycosyltransferase involved in cell wall biosynthesis
MRILIISNGIPPQIELCVTASHKRFQLFIDAFKSIAQLDVLLYWPASQPLSPEIIAQTQTALSQHWQVSNLNLQICPQVDQGFVQQLPKLLRYAPPVFNFFWNGLFSSTAGQQQVKAFEQCLDRQPDLIFAHRLTAMSPLLKTQRQLPPVLFDLDDIEHIRFAREVKQPPSNFMTPILNSHLPALVLGELTAIAKADATFVCSNQDQQYLTQRWNRTGVKAIPNSIAIPQYEALTQAQNALFIGTYSYKPNINAANFLIEQVWPQVRQQVPEANLLIAGPHIENLRTYGQSIPGVTFLGFVDDLTELYKEVRVVCCPIFSGSGTRVKMIEAAAYGKPIVATSIGVEGLNFTDGEDFILRNNPDSFAQACIDLLTDWQQSHELGIAARQSAIREYDREQVVQKIRQLAISFVGRSTSSQLVQV